eukprot:TRINITY_DN2593_c0_g4_i1.p1 TRINITY_DN2593_c0_g4~~TRINITY_DN2593_c0_g4_i1.p1  ORF type:complete len:731 (+),score=146.99 TRINITY_DN2593_c0_g4_i1:262-2454(+)
MMFALVCLSIIAAILGICIDLLSTWLYDLRMATLTIFTFEDENITAAVSFAAFFAITAAYALICIRICEYGGPSSEGSGIAEIKTIISGVNSYTYFALRTLIAKYFGLLFIIAAGFYVGRESPFVHVIACVTYNLLKIKAFHRIRENSLLLKQFLIAAVSLGVNITFGSIFGGILLSIEMTSSIYNVGNFWRSYMCALLCMFFLQYVRENSNMEVFSKTTFPKIDIWADIVPILMLGIACGFLGSAFTKGYQRVRSFLKQPAFLTRKRLLVLIVVAMICALPFLVEILRSLDRDIINDLFNLENLHEKKEWKVWMIGDSPWLALTVVLVAKAVLVLVCLSLPVPGGVFLPSLLLGAVIGRLYAEVLTMVMDIQFKCGFALVGAAALTANIARTLSIAVVICELTGQIDYMLPLFLVSFVSFSIGKWTALGFYDADIALKNMPFLPIFVAPSMHQTKAEELAEPCDAVLTLTSTIKDAVRILNRMGTINKLAFIPVVDDEISMRLEGAVICGRLIKYLRKMLTIQYDVMGGDEVREVLDFIDHLHTTDEEEIGKEGDTRVVRTARKLTEARLLPDIGLRTLRNKGAATVMSHTSLPLPMTAIKESDEREGGPPGHEEEPAEAMSEKAPEVMSERLPGPTFAIERQSSEFNVLRMRLDYENRHMGFYESPVVVAPRATMVRVHYLFCMLGTAAIFVVNKGVLQGRITKSRFLRLNCEAHNKELQQSGFGYAT